MFSGLSFHIAPRALDLGRAFSPKYLFADSVRHVINGHVPAQRYHQICTKSSAMALKEAALEQRMRELFALDLNPLIAMTRQLNSEFALFKAWNIYQKHVSLAVRTTIHGNSRESFSVERQQITFTIDPSAARSAGLCAVDILTAAARKNWEPGSLFNAQSELRLSMVAARLGLQNTIVYDVASVFEEQPDLNVARLCSLLGFHNRTLERHLKDFQISALDLKMACALVGATSGLWGASSLTEIAICHGFSDQSHMTRAFHKACGLPPMVLRQLVGNRQSPH